MFTSAQQLLQSEGSAGTEARASPRRRGHTKLATLLPGPGLHRRSPGLRLRLQQHPPPSSPCSLPFQPFLNEAYYTEAVHVPGLCPCPSVSFVRTGTLFCSPVYPWCLTRCLAQTRRSISTCPSPIHSPHCSQVFTPTRRPDSRLSHSAQTLRCLPAALGEFQLLGMSVGPVILDPCYVITPPSHAPNTGCVSGSF